MLQSTITSKFRITIPKEIREKFGIKPGQMIEVTAKGRIIELTPVPDEIAPKEKDSK